MAFQENHSTPFQKIFWADNSWFLYHDNAPSHTALVLRDHFAKNSTHIVPQPPYLSDLASCDFWLFPKLKRPLREHCFNTIEEIQAESKKALKAVTEIELNKLVVLTCIPLVELDVLQYVVQVEVRCKSILLYTSHHLAQLHRLTSVLILKVLALVTFLGESPLSNCFIRSISLSIALSRFLVLNSF